MKSITKNFQYGSFPVSIEIDAVAHRCNHSALVSAGDAVFLVTLVHANISLNHFSFFPLTVNYQERFYANGMIPGNYFKREMRPNDREILISRLIDRSIRPLFPAGLLKEVQITITVLSFDPEIPVEVLALNAVAVIITHSGLVSKQLFSVKMGYIDQQLVMNPTSSMLENSSLNLTVAGTKECIVMVESDANVLAHTVFLEAMKLAQEHIKTQITAMENTTADDQKLNFIQDSIDPDMMDFLSQETQLFFQKNPLDQPSEVKLDKKLKEEVLAKLSEDQKEHSRAIEYQLDQFYHQYLRRYVLDSKKRLDGRTGDDIRPISMKTHILPKAHGSALFTRGETQALAVATLGTEKDVQIIDEVGGLSKDRFLMQYNFPSYATSEIGPMGAPKRREIGHGHLAKKALKPVIPGNDFPYTLRVVSEILSSNGSSSMATVCASTLALMDAGVPIHSPVSGIAMGLIQDQDDYIILSDISGHEDAIGDMDFKIAGTGEGITALQMDIKTTSISSEMMAKIIEKGFHGMGRILDTMSPKTDSMNHDISPLAPTIRNITVPLDKIKDVIGKGGVMIKKITSETKTDINISNETGVVSVSGANKLSCDEAIRQIQVLTHDPIVGDVCVGKVVKIIESGAFINISVNKDGFLHLSCLDSQNQKRILKEGEEVEVKIVDIDKKGRIKLNYLRQ